MTVQHALVTQKTARIFTYGQLSEKTKNIWLIAHGYGFLAEYFIKKFEVFNPEENYFIVPEALNRFYKKELSGRVGATWMTSEDRENEIKDYILYLDKVYETFILQNNAKIIAFGFSQGVSTIVRWALKTNNKLTNIVLWAGSIPEDSLNEITRLNQLHPYILVGDEDEYITEEKLETLKKTLDNIGFTFSHIFYKGGHAILTEPLMQLLNELTKS